MKPVQIDGVRTKPPGDCVETYTLKGKLHTPTTTLLMLLLKKFFVRGDLFLR